MQSVQEPAVRPAVTQLSQKQKKPLSDCLTIVGAVKFVFMDVMEKFVTATPLLQAMTLIHLKILNVNYIHMKEEKSVTIYVEGTPHEWPKNELISYEQVVTLEVPSYPEHPEVTYLVKYRKGHGGKPEGVLAKGESVKVKNEMNFNVSETGQS